VTGELWWVVGLGTLALGVVIAYGFLNARRRSHDPVAQRQSEAATDRLYRQEERDNR